MSRHLLPDPSDPIRHPIVRTPPHGGLVDAQPIVSGTGQTGYNVRIVTPGQEDFLSAEREVTSSGFQCVFSQPLKPGLTKYQILQWKMYPASHRRTPEMHIYYLPAPVIASPSAGQSIGVKPTVSGGSGAPGATVDIVQAGSGAIIYGTATVASDGRWSSLLTTALPTGTFPFTCRQHLGGHYGDWSATVTVTVSG